MKIGIGVTTYNRPAHLKLFGEQLEKYTPADTLVHIANDNPRKGIAFRKNECLNALKECDYIFLFDSDCFPIKEGWIDFFIEASRASGQHHFMYLKDTPGIKQTGNWTNFVQKETYINRYDNCSGCMMFLTKRAVEICGGYNPRYGMYGFEHAGYSNRIHKAGLTPIGAYTCPAGAGEYIYSLDLDNHLPFNRQIKHEPSMANEIQNVPTYIALNKQIYMEDTEIHCPLIHCPL